MSQADINEMMRTFFGNHFSRDVRKKFNWWLVHSEEDERDEAMAELWEHSARETDLTTLDDLNRLKDQLQAKQRRAAKRKRVLLLSAAAIALLLVSSITTFFWSKKYFYAQHSGQEFVQVIVPDGETRSMVLDDSTHVFVNGGSLLIYPKEFTSDTRTVFLLNGEANFAVAKDPKRPFVVETQHISITALGTQFDVDTYPESRLVTTVLKEGQTKVVINDRRGQATTEQYLMEPNQMLSYDKETGKVQITSIDADQHASWTKGNLIFRAASFEEIMHTLEHRYGVHIICDQLHKMSGSYYVKFRSSESLEKVLDVLNNVSTHFTYRRQGNKVHIMPQ